MSFKGRTYNDTWGGRKTASALIQNPVDILEYIKRQLLGSPPIDTAAFDHADLDDRRALTVARQIVNESDADTDKLTRSLCEQFFLISKIIPDGSESVTGLHIPGFATGQTVTLSDLISISETIEPRLQDVFVEPEIKYAYDHGTGDYTQRIAVTNITADEWQPSYTPGFTDVDGARVWSACKSLYRKYGIIEPMPDSLKESEWIVDYAGALWRIEKLIDWMDKKRLEISVGWTRGRLWEAGTYIKLKLSHRTGNDELICVCEEVRKNKRSDRVAARIVMLEDTVWEATDEIIRITEDGGIRVTSASGIRTID